MSPLIQCCQSNYLLEGSTKESTHLIPPFPVDWVQETVVHGRIVGHDVCSWRLAPRETHELLADFNGQISHLSQFGVTRQRYGWKVEKRWNTYRMVDLRVENCELPESWILRITQILAIPLALQIDRIPNLAPAIHRAYLWLYSETDNVFFCLTNFWKAYLSFNIAIEKGPCKDEDDETYLLNRSKMGMSSSQTLESPEGSTQKPLHCGTARKAT